MRFDLIVVIPFIQKYLKTNSLLGMWPIRVEKFQCSERILSKASGKPNEISTARDANGKDATKLFLVLFFTLPFTSPRHTRYMGSWEDNSARRRICTDSPRIMRNNACIQIEIKSKASFSLRIISLAFCTAWFQSIYQTIRKVSNYIQIFLFYAVKRTGKGKT